MTIVHDGENIPTVSPKDPDSDVWYGFTYTLESGETISSSTWLINNVPVSNGQTEDGLTLNTSSIQDEVTKANIAGGTLGTRYLLTNRTVTNVTPSDDKSMHIFIRQK